MLNKFTSCHDGHLLEVILKSNHARESDWSDMILGTHKQTRTHIYTHHPMKAKKDDSKSSPSSSVFVLDLHSKQHETQNTVNSRYVEDEVLLKLLISLSKFSGPSCSKHR